MNNLEFPLRTIHLDYHTGPWIPDVARDFDAEEFADTFKRAHVDSVTVFATCHHGHAYWNTDRPERHPGLPLGFDLLKSQIESLHKVGIRAPIYLSVQCNEFCANQHPEWIALTPELQQVKRKVNSAFKAGWQVMDMSSPYQDYLAEQLEEVMEKFAPVDGVFMDMCWDQPSCSKWAIAGMQKKNLDPRKEEDRNRYAREVAHEYMARYRDIIDRAMEKYKKVAGVWFNSRPKTNLPVEKKFLRHVEVEALPTGGWGYAYFPYVARLVRPLGLPTLSHTGRFFKSWGDNASLKPEMALKYECCQILSQGMTNGVGDLLHPRAVPSKEVYDMIGRIYGHIKECEPYVMGGEHMSQIGLVVDPELGDQPGPSGIGATRALQQLQQQFDVIAPEADFTSYELLIIPETTQLTEDLQKSVRKYLEKDGKVIVCGRSAFTDEDIPVMEELGVKSFGISPFKETFMHVEDSVGEGLPEYPHVMYEQGMRVKPRAGAETLVKVGEPYFQRAYNHFSGHDYTPEDKISEYSAVIQNGNIITFAVPILEAYGKHSNHFHRMLLRNCLARLLPQPLVKADGPSVLETTVVHKNGNTVVHLLSFSPERRAEGLDIVEEPFPLVDMPISVKSSKKPENVYLAPAEKDLEWNYENGYVHTTVTMLDGHAMLVLENKTA